MSESPVERMAEDCGINAKVELDFDQRARAVKLEDFVSDNEYSTAAEIIHLRDLNAELLKTLKAVVALSDRKHDAWDAAHTAIAKAEGSR